MMTRKEALEVMRKNMPTDRSLPIYEALQTLIPELAESEDERVRKALIDGVRQIRCKNGITQEQMITYLEKQKDLDKMIIVSPEVWDNAISDAFENGKKEGEKQKEQKPAEDWREKRKEECPFRRNLDNNLYGCERYADVISACTGACSWVVDYPKLKEIQDKKEQKSNIEICPHSIKSKSYSMQKPTEWSEEDKHCIHQLILFCENCMQQDSEAIRCATWLKSLRPQSHWKPSEEQMEAIENVIKCELSAGLHTRANILQTLQNELKKL